jgi:GNAT superfamily N-acetyltransferase
MTITPLVENDLPLLSPLQPDGWKDILVPFRFYLAHPQCFPIKAVADGALAGVGVGILFDKTAWLAHIIVHPDFRRRGIGALVVGSLQRKLTHDHGCRTLSLIATDLGRPVYARAGFTDLVEYAFLARDDSAVPAVPENSAIRPYIADDENAILSLDQLVSGERRDWVLREHVSQALVYTTAVGVMAGCYLPTLGEGLILARTPAAGRALLSRKIASSPRIALPAANIDALDLLTKRGYKETMRCWRMIYGAPLAWRPASVYARIAGNMG